MPEQEQKCGECGKTFGSREILEEHFKLEHPDKEVWATRKQGSEFGRVLRKHMNTSTFLGFFLGVLLTSGAIAGGIMYEDYTENNVEISVITCDNCSYERFKTVTNRMMNAEYREIDYSSKKGEKLARKYELSYIPGFIFEKDVEEHENFTQIRNQLIKFEDGYVMTDKGVETAQRFSKGRSISGN